MLGRKLKNYVLIILFSTPTFLLHQTGIAQSSSMIEPEMESIPLKSLPEANFIPAAPIIDADSYILMDPHSQYIIAQDGADKRVEPASLTKMMTVYVLDQALKSNRANLSDKVFISERAWRSTGSRMFLDLKSEVSLEELLKGIIIQSGNDASIALAEHIAGSEDAFADLMNHYAKELGMNNTHFVNSTGLPDPNHYTTAKDMSIIASRVVRDFPETYKLYSQKEFTYKNIKQTNRNRLLWQADWIDGIKTGHTDNAGFCLAASGKKDNMRLVAIVMGTKTDGVRTTETSKLLNYGFQFYESRNLYPANTSLKQTRVWKGKEKEVNLGLAEDFYITVGHGQYDKLKANIVVDKGIKAPIKEGDVLGTISVLLDDKVISERPLIALNTIPQAGFFGRFFDSIALIFHTLWSKVFA